MRLGQAHFPRQAGIFDACCRARAGAAVMAGNQDHIRLGFGHTGGNRADTRLRHQFDADLDGRVDLLEVIDELRQILDTINIVMRRRRNQRHTLGRMAQPRNQLGHFHARQLPALTGLGTLGNLDFQFLAMVEVFRRHAKAARGHLLDLGRRVVAIGLRREMRRVFAALATVRARADPVHRHIERLVRLGAERPQRHARRDKALADRRHALDLFNRDRLAQRLDRHQVAQMNGRIGLHRRAVAFPELIARLVAGGLQDMHRLRTPGRFPRLVEPADGQNILRPAPAFAVHLFQLGLNTAHADAADAAGQTGEIFRAHGAAQAHRLEIQTAAIRGNHRNSHLRHDLQETLINRRAIACDRLGQAAVNQAARNAVCDAVLGQIGVDHRCPGADQHREIMRVDTFGRAHIQAREGAQSLAGQVAMHGTCRQNHRHADAVLVLVLVRQNEMPGARADGILCLCADPFQPLLQRVLAGCKGTVDLGHIGVELLDHLRPLGVAHEGAFEHQNLGLRARFIKHVLEVAEPGLQAHHPVFAQAVDRRVRHLAEILPEKMAQRAILLGQNGAWRVIAHACYGFFAIFGHGGQNLLQLLNAVTGRNLALAQFRPGIERRFAHTRERVVQFVDLADPLAKGLCIRQPVLDLGVVIELALGHIHGQHLTGPKRALFLDRALVNRHHPGLGPCNHQPVTCHHIAHRAQAVAVKPGADPATIGHRQRGRAIPRLHHRVAIGIHIAPRLRQFLGLLGPGFRHQHGLGHRRGPSGAHQNLEHGVQRRAVA